MEEANVSVYIQGAGKFWFGVQLISEQSPP